MMHIIAPARSCAPNVVARNAVASKRTRIAHGKGNPRSPLLFLSFSHMSRIGKNGMSQVSFVAIPSSPPPEDVDRSSATARDADVHTALMPGTAVHVTRPPPPFSSRTARPARNLHPILQDMTLGGRVGEGRDDLARARSQARLGMRRHFPGSKLQALQPAGAADVCSPCAGRTKRGIGSERGRGRVRV